MTNSRRKGKSGELEAAKALRAIGFDGARRGQQFKGGSDSPDIVDAIAGVHIEVKRTEQFRLWDAMSQSSMERSDGEVPIVMHKRNRSEWVVIVPLAHVIDFARCVEAAIQDATHRAFTRATFTRAAKEQP